jgi:hypothetical protein
MVLTYAAGVNPSRAYYQAPVSTFLLSSDQAVLGELSQHHSHALDEKQKNAWLRQLRVLKSQLAHLREGHLYLEFSIPRMGLRADAVLLLDAAIYVLEFKVGGVNYEPSAIDQVMDYAVDLSNFHEGSHDRTIIPVLVATKAPTKPLGCPELIGVTACVLANESTLGEYLATLRARLPRGLSLNPQAWERSRYRPTPTIIQAAQALYHGHRVEEISRTEAGAINLSTTAACLADIIQQSKEQRQKSICFVTGVPGAGKTLAGLNLACSRQRSEQDEHAVFLSGNGPLVEVLREALAQDQAEREGVLMREARMKASSFIQNIHHFRDESLLTPDAPIERVVVFDEAQRAWDSKHLARFMSEKKGMEDFTQSEPEFLISVMDRGPDWCTVVCLIGGGQEINDGEAGISEWFSALSQHFRHWKVWCSPRLGSGDYQLGASLQQMEAQLQIHTREELHLGVSLRSFRSEVLSDFVSNLLDGNTSAAGDFARKLSDKYPLLMTRELETARAWLKSQARGSELYGLLASSGAIRLKADGVHVKARINAVDWFLKGKDDVRSCYYLEDVGTEFDVQGLELDWTCVCWDAELCREGEAWSYRRFRGTRWEQVQKEADQRYTQNTYRVLLTRARQGMIIFVPRGSADDPTRPPSTYNAIAQYLKSCGVVEVDHASLAGASNLPASAAPTSIPRAS